MYTLTNNQFNSLFNDGFRPDIKREVERQLYNDTKTEKQFEAYQRCINEIDDFFEYQYQIHDPKQIKKMVMFYIDKLNDKLKELNK